MNGYTTQDVARLLDLPAHRIRSYARAGFTAPARGSRNEYRFTFQDLVLLRTAAELSRARVPARRITQTLRRLQQMLPDGRPLSELRVVVTGDEVVVRDSSAPPWNPRSGQLHIDFDTAEIATRVAELSPRVDIAPAASSIGERQDGAVVTASDWFDHALELEVDAPADACAAYQHALELDPGHIDARVNLGRLLHQEGLPDEAEAAYRQVLARGEHALAAYNLGVLLEDAGRTPDAIQAYARALAAEPQLADAHYNLSRLYEQQGDRRAAIRHLNGYRELMKGR